MFRSPLLRLWIGVAAELLCVGLMTRHGDFLRAGEPLRFTALAVAAGAAFWLAVDGFLRAEFSPGKDARWFWVVAAVLRLAMLLVLPGDDVWRYRWEGAIQLHGYNPYALAPDSPALASLRDVEWGRISHQNEAAIYPPLAEMVFRWMARGGWTVLGYKLLFACADLAVAGILCHLLARAGTTPKSAAWYAWNPLAVYVGAGGAHFDPLMVLCMMGAIWCLDRSAEEPPVKNGPSARRAQTLAWASAALLGLAIALKAVPIVLLPLWVCALGWRRALLTLPVAVGLSPALACLYGFPGVPVFGGLGRFSRGFQVNEVLWWLLDPAGRASAWYGGIAAAGCLALAVWFRRDWRRGTLWVLGTALLFSPAVHAWYALWILPVAVWRGKEAWPWVVFSVSVFGYFLLWEVNQGSGRPWQEPLWLRAAVYLPPLLAFGWQRIVRPSAPVQPSETC